MLPGQLDLFVSSSAVTASSTTIIGLMVELPRSCRCGSCISTIGSSKGPHYAELSCAACDGHTGWLPRQAIPLINGIIDAFGRPTQPIILRKDYSKC
jgi:hypothetical protein